MLGDAYWETDNEEIAKFYCLKALGWDQAQYEAYCARHDDCRDLAAIARR